MKAVCTAYGGRLFAWPGSAAEAEERFQALNDQLVDSKVARGAPGVICQPYTCRKIQLLVTPDLETRSLLAFPGVFRNLKERKYGTSELPMECMHTNSMQNGIKPMLRPL